MDSVLDPVFERVEGWVWFDYELNRSLQRVDDADCRQLCHLGGKAHIDVYGIRTRDVVEIAVDLALIERFQDDVVRQIDQFIAHLDGVDDG